jgi:hypothetical protein
MLRKILGLTIAAVTVPHFCEAKFPYDDALAPRDRSDKKIENYHRLLNAKLSVTPFDCGRVLDTPSFERENMVSVYSRLRKGQRTYYVSLVEPEAQLWKYSDLKKQTHDARNVPVRRIEAEIPASLGKRLKQAWLEMLQRLRPLRREPGANPNSEAEFEFTGTLHFSIQRANRPPLEGELWTPPPGKKTQMFKEISDDLYKYCEAIPAKRPAIANRIDRHARQLLDEIKSRSR